MLVVSRRPRLPVRLDPFLRHNLESIGVLVLLRGRGSALLANGVNALLDPYKPWPADSLYGFSAALEALSLASVSDFTSG
jgi:hypothetical protein